MYKQHWVWAIHLSYLRIVNIECVAKNLTLFIISDTFRVSTIVSTFCLFLFSVCPFCSFMLLYFFSLFWHHIECACLLCYGLMFRLVVSGPVSLSLSTLFAALILGFVCSIWAKFSNGDNYRGRPGERRRWVLPFLSSELHASPSQSTTSPSIPCVSPHFSHCVCHQRSSGTLSLLS